MRRYVRLARDIWDFLRRQPDDVKLIYLYLIDFPVETLTGIVRWDEEKFEFHNKDWTAERVDAALGILESGGHVVRDGEFLWLREFTSEQGFAGDRVGRGISAELERIAAKSEKLVLAYVERYPIYRVCIPYQYPMHRAHSGKEQEQEQEQEITPLPPLPVEPQPQPQPELAPKPESRKRQIEPAKYLQLQLRINQFITEQIELTNTHHSGIDNLHPDGARELRLLVEQDGMPEADIMPCLEWAWRHRLPNGDYYGTVLLSIRGWRGGRKDGDLGKFWRAHRQWLKETGGLKQAAPEMTEEQRQAYIEERRRAIEDEEKRRQVQRQLQQEREQRTERQERESAEEIEARRQAGLRRAQELADAPVH